MKPHKHAELIKAWADGQKIQTRCKWLATDEWSEWADSDIPAWHLSAEYRIKPERRPDIVGFCKVFLNEYKSIEFSSPYAGTPRWESDNLKIIFDGETLKPKSAEVI